VQRLPRGWAFFADFERCLNAEMAVQNLRLLAQFQLLHPVPIPTPVEAGAN